MLDRSKHIMTAFWYDTIKKNYGSRSKLLYSDTDSFCFQLMTENLEKDLKLIHHKMDYSNYPPEHPLFSNENCAKLGYFKHELGAHIIISAVFIKPKCYNLLLKLDPLQKLKEQKNNNISHKIRADHRGEYKKTKGVPADSMKDYEHESYCNVIIDEKPIISNFHKLSTLNHFISENCIRKQAIGLSTDKRFLLNCSICTLAYGHKNISKNPECNCFL